MSKRKYPVVKQSFDGVEYMSIPHHAIRVANDMQPGDHEQNCATAWFRTGCEKEILEGKLPKDFMRCLKCGGNSFKVYCGDTYSETTCKSCGNETADMRWAWMESLFPDPAVRKAIEYNNNLVEWDE